MNMQTGLNMENVTIPDLYELLKKKLLNLISHFLMTENAPYKKKWMDFMRIIYEDKKTWKKFDAEMKINHIQ